MHLRSRVHTDPSAAVRATPLWSLQVTIANTCSFVCFFALCLLRHGVSTAGETFSDTQSVVVLYNFHVNPR